MSKVVELRPLAITDLNVKYARRMEGNKITHYVVSALPSLVGIDMKPAEMVAQHIRDEEGDVEVKIVDPVIPHDSKQVTGTMYVKDVSDVVLKGMGKVRKELLKVKTKGQIYQDIRIITPRDLQFYGRSVVDPDGKSTKIDIPSILTAHIVSFAGKIGLSRFVPEKYKIRRITPVSYLSYSYEEPQEKKAIEEMRSDLSKLSKRGLLMGHLAMPSVLYLADSVGSGEAQKALFAFILVDLDKLAAQENTTLLGLPKLPLTAAGVGSQANEGDLGHSLRPDYEITEVFVSTATSAANTKAVVDNYLENRPYIQEAAKNMAKRMENSEIKTESHTVFKQSEDGRRFDNQLNVNISITKKK